MCSSKICGSILVLLLLHITVQGSPSRPYINHIHSTPKWSGGYVACWKILTTAILSRLHCFAAIWCEARISKNMYENTIGDWRTRSSLFASFFKVTGACVESDDPSQTSCDNLGEPKEGAEVCHSLEKALCIQIKKLFLSLRSPWVDGGSTTPAGFDWPYFDFVHVVSICMYVCMYMCIICLCVWP